MIVCTLLTIVVVCALVASMISRRDRPARPRNRLGRQVVHYRPAHPPQQRKQKRPPQQQKRPQQHHGDRAAGLTEAQVMAILERALGAVWQADQERIRAQVRAQERAVATRLRQAQRDLDFAELRALHEKSRQTADLAYAQLDGARATEQTISDNIRGMHRAIESEQARGGRNVATMRQSLDALHVDRDVIRSYRDRYEQDLHRLNKETGRLRDAIGANCGVQGRRWHQALMERTRARKEGRR